MVPSSGATADAAADKGDNGSDEWRWQITKITMMNKWYQLPGRWSWRQLAGNFRDIYAICLSSSSWSPGWMKGWIIEHRCVCVSSIHSHCTLCTVPHMAPQHWELFLCKEKLHNNRAQTITIMLRIVWRYYFVRGTTEDCEDCVRWGELNDDWWRRRWNCIVSYQSSDDDENDIMFSSLMRREKER